MATQVDVDYVVRLQSPCSRNGHQVRERLVDLYLERSLAKALPFSLAWRLPGYKNQASRSPDSPPFIQGPLGSVESLQPEKKEMAMTMLLDTALHLSLVVLPAICLFWALSKLGLESVVDAFGGTLGALIFTAWMVATIPIAFDLGLWGELKVERIAREGKQIG